MLYSTALHYLACFFETIAWMKLCSMAWQLNSRKISKPTEIAKSVSKTKVCFRSSQVSQKNANLVEP